MVQVVAAVALMCGAVAVGLVLRRRRPSAAPTQPSRAVPAQIDRADFPQATAPWVVVVFSSGTCHTCEDVVRKASVLASSEVDVVDVEYRAAPSLHRKYDIHAVPIIAVADADGVVHRGFAGPVTATDLWAAVADARQPGSSPEPDLGH
ncbi:MAG: hypothetical protein KGR47_00340 [Acidobacteria bacterium]|nr:hypothetical protein [Acidobacteriota bacterium]